LDEPGLASASATPEPEKESDAAALEVRPDTTTIAESSVPEETPAPATTEAKGDDAGAGPVEGDGYQVSLLCHPIPRVSILPEARLITAGEVAGIPQQQRIAEEVDVAGTSSGNILVTPHGWQYAVPTELLDDPMLTVESPKHF
jgi:hypothetical protein